MFGMEMIIGGSSQRAQLLKDDGSLRRRDDNSRSKVQNVRRDSSAEFYLGETCESETATEALRKPDITPFQSVPVF